MTSIGGLILAGGAGRRLGGVDKAFLRLHDRLLIAHAIERLAGQARPVAISAAGDVSRFDRFGLMVVQDGAARGKGPLAGVLAGLIWAHETGIEALLTLPVDTPFAPRNLAAGLSPAPAAARHGARVHHLVALWPVSAIAPLRAFLAGGEPYRVSDFARRIGSRDVAFAGDTDPFFNINTADDLAIAEARA